MKTYVVNLDKSVNRLKRMEKQLGDLGMEFIRVPAIYGASLSQEDRKRCFRPIRSWFAMGRRLLDGEVGCSLSHIDVYRRMEQEGVKIALILEDDVLIASEISEAITRIENFANINLPQVFILSNYSGNLRKENTINRIHMATCTDGYVITLPAARAILKANYPVVTTADPWPRWERLLGLELYQCWPRTVRQFCLEGFESEIQKPSSKVVQINNIIEKAIGKCIRVFARIVDRVLLLFAL